jgi:hypothetical protein
MVRGIRIRRGFAGWKLPQLPLLALLIPEPRDSQAPTPKQNHLRRGSGLGSQLSSQRPTLRKYNLQRKVLLPRALKSTPIRAQDPLCSPGWPDCAATSRSRCCVHRDSASRHRRVVFSNGGLGQTLLLRCAFAGLGTFDPEESRAKSSRSRGEVHRWHVSKRVFGQLKRGWCGQLIA